MATQGSPARLWTLGLLVCASLVLAGCSFQQPPDRPERLTNASVADYVVELERHQHDGFRVEDIQVGCEPTVTARSDRSFVVTAQCGGGVVYRDGSHVDLLTYPVRYYVNDRTTVRLKADEPVPPTRRRDLDNATGFGFVSYNLGQAPHTVSVAVTRVEDGRRVAGFEYTVVPPRHHDPGNDSQWLQSGVPVVSGTAYRVAVAVDGDRRRTFAWRPAHGSGGIPRWPVIYLTPDGVLVGQVDLWEPRRPGSATEERRRSRRVP